MMGRGSYPTSGAITPMVATITANPTTAASAATPSLPVRPKATPIANQSLAFVGLDRYFPVVVGFDDTTRHKPDPEPVHHALRRIGVTAEQAVFVGDSPHDIHAGNAAGVTTIAALWGPFDRETLARAAPDHFIECLADLPGLLDRAFGR